MRGTTIEIACLTGEELMDIYKTIAINFKAVTRELFERSHFSWEKERERERGGDFIFQSRNRASCSRGFNLLQ